MNDFTSFIKENKDFFLMKYFIDGQKLKNQPMTEKHKDELHDFVRYICHSWFDNYVDFYYCLYELTKTYDDMFGLFCHLANMDLFTRTFMDVLSAMFGKDIVSSKDPYGNIHNEIEYEEFVKYYRDHKKRRTVSNE